jgi:hypothetical protein
MNSELEDLEGNGHGLLETLSKCLRGAGEEDYKKPVRIADIVAGVRTEHPSKTDLEWYRFTNPPGRAKSRPSKQ